MNIPLQNIPINILLAEDDSDDRFFFDKAIKSLPVNTSLKIVENGERLMAYLLQNAAQLPDVLFLDYNMPRKNGAECLSEIKRNPVLVALPVVIYSTYLHIDVADVLYINGAHYYINKSDLPELKKTLHYIFTLILEKKFTRPTREGFILFPVKV